MFRGRDFTLDALVSAELTLISAPAGSGKTVLLGSWCAFQSRASVAWVSLDAADDDPVRLWTYIATAVDRIRPGLGRMALLRLRTPGVALETCVDELLNGVSAYGEPLALALDDLHVLRSATCLESLEYAIEHLPRNARVIATARADPPIALARLRGRGQLGELRARDLAFSLDEARALLVDREALSLDGGDLEVLLERSEGWPAGLYLAALWLRGAADPKEGVREFGGDQRQIADFLDAALLLGAGVLVVSAFGLSIGAKVVTEAGAEIARELGGEGSGAGALGNLTELAGSLALALLAFLLLYRVAPSVSVRVRDAFPGAVVAAIGFHLASAGFAPYLEYIADFDDVYGPLGAVLAFLLLVYIAAVVLLLGAAVAAAWPETKQPPAPAAHDPIPMRRRIAHALRGLVARDPRQRRRLGGAGREAACPRSGPVEGVWGNREVPPATQRAMSGLCPCSVCNDRLSGVVIQKRLLRPLSGGRPALADGLDANEVDAEVPQSLEDAVQLCLVDYVRQQDGLLVARPDPFDRLSDTAANDTPNHDSVSHDIRPRCRHLCSG